MKLSWVVILFELCFHDIVSDNIFMTKRVIGGDLAPLDKYHWAVSLKGSVKSLRRSVACGASLLKTMGDAQWLVSAAHCFFPSFTLRLTDAKLWYARVGLRQVDFSYENVDLNHKVKSRLKSFFNQAYRKVFGKEKFKLSLEELHIKKIYIHPDYAVGRLENDIALIELIDPLPIHEIKWVNTIEMMNQSVRISWPTEGSKCIVIGWGCTNAGGSPSPIAKLAELDIWNNSKCEEAFKVPIDLNPESEFCAGYLNKTYGICPGDSGSGLACTYNGEWRLAGVVSAVHRHRPGQFPALFTRTSYFQAWIEETTRVK